MGGFCLIICSFWGHQTLYDLDLADRVQNAIAQVVAQDDEIEFRLVQHRFLRSHLSLCCHGGEAEVSKQTHFSGADPNAPS